MVAEEVKMAEAPAAALAAPEGLGAQQLPQPAPQPAAPQPAQPADEIEDQGEEEEEGKYEPYGAEELRQANPGLKTHPDPLVESASLASVPLPDLEGALAFQHKLQAVIKAGNISDSQLQTVIYSSMKFHGPRLADGKRAGFFLGDGAGVGKGRQIAALVQQHCMEGGSRVLWLSVSADLRKDSQRDLRDVGCKLKLFPDGAKQPNPKLRKEAPPSAALWFCTYSALVNGLPKAEKGRAGQKGKAEGMRIKFTKDSRPHQIISWLAGDPSGSPLIVLDECHKAKNAIGNPSQTARAVVELQEQLPEAKVLYSSATGASEARNLAYMTRLGLWGAADAVEFLDVLNKSRTGALELTALSLKATGSYLSRTLSYQGAEFELREVPVDDKFKSSYDTSTALWGLMWRVVGNLVKNSAVFWGAHQRFWRQVVMAGKVDDLVLIAQKALAAGQCVVIGLQSTGEANLEKQKELTGDELDDLASAPQMILESYMRKHWPEENTSTCAVDVDAVVFGAVDALEHWVTQQETGAPAEYDALAATHLCPYQALNPAQIQAGEAKLDRLEAAVQRMNLGKLQEQQAEAAAEVAELQEALKKAQAAQPAAATVNTTTGGPHVRQQNSKRPVQQQQRQNAMLYPMFTKVVAAAAAKKPAGKQPAAAGPPAKKRAVTPPPAVGGTSRPVAVAAELPAVAPAGNEEDDEYIVIPDSGSEDDDLDFIVPPRFKRALQPKAAPKPAAAPAAPAPAVAKQPAGKQPTRGAKAAPAKNKKPAGKAAAAGTKRPLVIDDSSAEESDSADFENRPAPAQRGNGVAGAAAGDGASSARVTRELQAKVAAAQADLKKASTRLATAQLAAQPPPPSDGAAAAGARGVAGRRGHRPSAQPQSYAEFYASDDDDNDEGPEGPAKHTSASRSSSGGKGKGKGMGMGKVKGAAAGAGVLPRQRSLGSCDSGADEMAAEVAAAATAGAAAGGGRSSRMSYEGEESEFEEEEDSGDEMHRGARGMDHDGSDGEEGFGEEEGQEEAGQRRHEALLNRLRSMLLHLASSLELPHNPLDNLVARLGGSAHVAEMTGRKHTVVPNPDGKGATIKPRTATNLQEQESFMKGRKLVAILSDAASTGISLQADRRVPNQRRRCHITLELPWSADKAIQQFGRSHRSNQASAPTYKLLVTPLAGEFRFASAAAKRLQSLGALLHGHRHSTGAGSELKAFDVDTKYGAEALDLALTAILGTAFGSMRKRSKLSVKVAPPPVPAGYICDEEVLPPLGGSPATDPEQRFYQYMSARLLGVGLFKPDMTGQPQLPKDKVAVRSFLNRLLGLRLSDQQLMFAFFSSALDKVIGAYRAMGQVDSGIMTVRGESCQIRSEQTVHTAQGGGDVKRVEVELDRGVSFEAACGMRDDAVERTTRAEGEDYRHHSGFYIGPAVVTAGGAQRKKNIVLAAELGRSLSNEPKLAITRPNTGSCGSWTLGELKDKGYCRARDGDAEATWSFWYEHCFSQCGHGDTCTTSGCSTGARHSSLYLLSGAVLPLLKKLEQWRARSQWARRGMSADSDSTRPLKILKVVTSSGASVVGIEAMEAAEMANWLSRITKMEQDEEEKEHAAELAAELAAAAERAHAALAAALAEAEVGPLATGKPHAQEAAVAVLDPLAMAAAAAAAAGPEATAAAAAKMQAALASAAAGGHLCAATHSSTLAAACAEPEAPRDAAAAAAERRAAAAMAGGVGGSPGGSGGQGVMAAGGIPAAAGRQAGGGLRGRLAAALADPKPLATKLGAGSEPAAAPGGSSPLAAAVQAGGNQPCAPGAAGSAEQAIADLLRQHGAEKLMGLIAQVQLAGSVGGKQEGGQAMAVKAEPADVRVKPEPE